MGICADEQGDNVTCEHESCRYCCRCVEVMPCPGTVSSTSGELVAPHATTASKNLKGRAMKNLTAVKDDLVKSVPNRFGGVARSWYIGSTTPCRLHLYAAALPNSQTQHRTTFNFLRSHLVPCPLHVAHTGNAFAFCPFFPFHHLLL